MLSHSTRMLASSREYKPMPKTPKQPAHDINADKIDDNTDPLASHLKAIRDVAAGQFTMMDRDDLVHYNKFCAGIVASLKPENTAETRLAQSIASGYWGLNRVRALEDGIFALNAAGSASPSQTFLSKQADFKALSRHEMRLQGALDGHKADLKRLQAGRAGHEPGI